MARWSAGTVLTAVVFLLFVPQACALTVERTVADEGNATYRVTLTLSDETVAGIAEFLPDGCEVLGVSLPPDQYRERGKTLFLVALVERNVTYVLAAAENPERALSGSWTDFETGKTGSIVPAGSVQPRDTPAPGEGDRDSTRKSGPAPVVSLAAAACALGAAGIISRGRRGIP
ncbi:MAG: hypothetical protein QXL43_03365 [Methanolinea sp.]